MGSSIDASVERYITAWFSVALLIILLVAATGSVGATLTPVDTDHSSVDIGTAHLIIGIPQEPLQAESTPSNDTEPSADLPPPHRNPSKIEQSGDLGQLESILGESLNGKLDDSLERLDAEDYERARELLGEEYDTDLDRYVDIAEETDSTTEATQYETTQSRQKEYVDAIEQYEQSQSAYEQAQTAGNDQRARELAREVVTAATEVNATGEQLSNTYQAYEEATGINTSERRQQIETRQTAAQQTRQQITATELRETTLSVATNRSTVSFTDSVTVRGDVQTSSGAPITSQQIQLLINGQSYTTELDTDGSFQQQFQPEGVWQSGSPTIRYVPDPESLYLGSQTRLPVTIESTPTNIAVNPINGSVDYDSSLRVRGRLTTADTDEPVPTAPVVLRVGGQQIETVQTTSEGQFQFQTLIPPGVPAGTVSTRVELGSSSLALNPSQAETPVQINPTNTSLTVDATASSPTEIQVRGQLQSEGGRGVSSMPVSIQISDTDVTTFQTGDSGRFETTVTPPETVGSRESVVVTAQFSGADSNLQAATATTTLALPQANGSAAVGGTTGGDSGLGGFPRDSIGILLLLGIALVAAVTGWWLWQRRPVQAVPADTAPTESGTESAPESSDRLSETDRLLEAANEALTNQESESAVQFAYIAVRRYFSTSVEANEAATHWEWYQACTTAGVDQLSEIQSLIEDFEQVTFAPPTDQTKAVADRVVSTARKLITDD